MDDRCPACQRRYARLGVARYYRSHDRTDDVVVPVFRCPDCGLLHQRIPPGTREGHFASASYTNPDRESHLRAKRMELYRWVLDALPAPPGTLLDVGSSYGHLLEQARRRGWDVMGVEPVAACAAVAERAGFDVTHGSFPDAAPPAGDIDVITFLDSFYLLPDPLLAAETARKLLAPDGRVVMRVTNRGYLWRVAAAASTARGRAHLPGWLMGDASFGFGPRSVRAVLARVGFTDISIEAEPSRVQTREGRATKALYLVGDGARLASANRIHLSPGLLVTARATA